MLAGWKKPKSFERNYDGEDMSDTFRKQKMDSLTEHLGCTAYFHKMRWPWFYVEQFGVKRPLEVDRYYHEKKLAIDFGKVADVYLAVKKLQLEKQGISYVLLENERDLKNLAKGLS